MTRPQYAKLYIKALMTCSGRKYDGGPCVLRNELYESVPNSMVKDLDLPWGALAHNSGSGHAAHHSIGDRKGDGKSPEFMEV